MTAALVAIALLPATLSLGACTATDATAKDLTALPEGVTVDIYQNRIDYAEHKIEVAVANDSRHSFEVRSLSFSSPRFHPAVDYERAPSTVRAGTSTDFRLLLPLADCHATSDTPTVVIGFAVGDRTGHVSLSPKDRIGQLPTIAAEDCRGDAVAAVATISAAQAVRYTSVGGVKTAILDFTATPTGAGGLLTLDDVRGTVLLGALNPATGVVGDTVPLGIDVGDATQPVTFSLTLVPARCDPHVVLEDKRGTFFTFTVTTSLDTGRIFVGVSDDVRIELYDYVGERCGWT
ncbi:MAG: hypothetical protein KF801_05335 [Cryobacterium sp.]|nr:hypothetical protein [Cryobacterium sp.]